MAINVRCGRLIKFSEVLLLLEFVWSNGCQKSSPLTGGNSRREISGEPIWDKKSFFVAS